MMTTDMTHFLLMTLKERIILNWKKASATAFVSQTRSRFRWKETAEVGDKCCYIRKVFMQFRVIKPEQIIIEIVFASIMEFHISCHLFGFFNEDFIEHFLDEFSFSFFLQSGQAVPVHGDYTIALLFPPL